MSSGPRRQTHGRRGVFPRLYDGVGFPDEREAETRIPATHCEFTRLHKERQNGAVPGRDCPVTTRNAGRQRAHQLT